MSEERLAPVQGYSAGIPWSMHLRAYDAYCKEHGKQQALIEGHCRGGFGVNELDMFIPGWREELSELHRLRTRLAAAERELKEIKEDVVEHVHDGLPFNWTEAVVIIREERANAAAVREAARRRVAANLQAAVRDKWPDPDGIQHRVGMACARYVADGTDLLAGAE
jgi:hypothetical protein